MKKKDLQRILAWFLIDYFQHNLDLVAQSRISFCAHYDEDQTLADETDYKWGPESYFDLFFSSPITISISAIQTISVHNKYLRLRPLTTDTTLLNYTTLFFHDKLLSSS